MPPAKRELNGLRLGHFCKLKEESGSYFWVVLIVRAWEERCFQCRVEAWVPGMRRVDPVFFEKKNVFEIL